MVWMGRKMEMESKKKYLVVKIWKDFQIGLEKVFKIDGTVCSDIPIKFIFLSKYLPLVEGRGGRA